VIRVIIDNAMLSAFLELECTDLLTKIALKLGWVYDIPSHVKEEALARFDRVPKSMEDRIEQLGIEKTMDGTKLDVLKDRFFSLGKGELEAIHLALEYQESQTDYIIILDDEAARSKAVQSKLNLHGTIWLICQAVKAGIIDRISLKPYLQGLKKINFRYEEGIVEQILKEI